MSMFFLFKINVYLISALSSEWLGCGRMVWIFEMSSKKSDLRYQNRTENPLEIEWQKITDYKVTGKISLARITSDISNWSLTNACLAIPACPSPEYSTPEKTILTQPLGRTRDAYDVLFRAGIAGEKLATSQRCDARSEVHQVVWAAINQI